MQVPGFGFRAVQTLAQEDTDYERTSAQKPSLLWIVGFKSLMIRYLDSTSSTASQACRTTQRTISSRRATIAGVAGSATRALANVLPKDSNKHHSHSWQYRPYIAPHVTIM